MFHRIRSVVVSNLCYIVSISGSSGSYSENVVFFFTNTYFHPSPAHIRRKNPVFDGRVLIDLNTYQSLDEGQRDMLKEHGLVINIVNSQ